MVDEHHAHERHHPLIEAGQQELRRAYVDMLTRLNKDIAKEMHRARGLSKGQVFLVLPGGLAERPSMMVADTGPSDLMKGHVPGVEATAKEEGKYKNNPNYVKKLIGKVHRWVRATPEETKAKRRRLLEAGVQPDEAIHEDEGKGKGKGEKKPAADEPLELTWYKDSHGNVQYLPEPVGDFTEPLTKDELDKQKVALTNIVTALSPQDMSALAKDHLKVDLEVLTTLRDSVNMAATMGMEPVEYFSEQYVRGILGEEGELDEEQLREGRELFSNMVSVFDEFLLRSKETENNWDEKVKDAHRAKETLIRKIHVAAREQQKYLGEEAEHYNAFVIQDDVGVEADKLTALMHDLHLFTIPRSLVEARPYSENDEEAKANVGTLFFDRDRVDSLANAADSLIPEQQLALAVADFMLAAKAKFDEDEDTYSILEEDGRKARQDYWQERREYDIQTFDILRSQLANWGLEYDEDEWNGVRDSTLNLAEHVLTRLDSYNERRPEGQVLQHLWRGETTAKELITNPEALRDMQDMVAAKMRRVEAALRAQTDEGRTHKIDDRVLNGVKKAYGPKANLFGYQKQAVAWMEAIESGLLAYDAGMGKTPISIAYISSMLAAGKIKRGILVLPSTLVDQWPKEIEKYRPGSKTVVISRDDSAEDRLLKLKAINSGELEADFVIMTASVLRHTEETQTKLDSMKASAKALHGRKKWLEAYHEEIRTSGVLAGDAIIGELARLDGAMLFDEVHSAAQGLKNSKNMQHHYAEEILRHRKYKFGLTATPIVAGAEDLYTLSELFHPGSSGESADWLANRIEKSETDAETGERIKVKADPEKMRKAKLALKAYVYFRRKTMKDVAAEMDAMGMGLPQINPVAHGISLGDALDEYEKCGAKGYDTNVHPWTRTEDQPLVAEYEKLRVREKAGETLDEKERQRLEYLDEQYGYRRTDIDVEAELLERELSPSRIAAILKNRALLRQQLAAISPKLINKDYKGPSPKLDETTDIVKRHFSNPENNNTPVVIFGSFLSSLDMQKQALIDAGIHEHEIGLITGEQDQDTRAATQDAVNAGAMKVVLIGIKAGGAGLNLQEKAYRAVFLDKPWTPADMEQAVGRVWRTGQKNMVHVHHLKVNGTVDHRKYTRIAGRIDLTDKLAYADLGEDFVSESIRASYHRLLGTFDVDDVAKLPPAVLAEFRRNAGLATHDMPQVLDMGTSDFSLTTFQDKIEKEQFKATGDWKTKDAMTLNDLRLKAGKITREQHKRAKKQISQRAQEWLDAVGLAGKTTVLQHFGKDFDWDSSHDGGVLRESDGTREPPKKKNQKQLREQPQNEGQQAAGGALVDHVIATAKGKKGASKKEAPAAPAKAPKGKVAAPAKAPGVGGAVKFNAKAASPDAVGGKDDFHRWVYTMLKRTPPKTYADVVKVVGEAVYEHTKKYYPDDAYTKKQALERARVHLEEKGLLEKFTKLGFFEVAE